MSRSDLDILREQIKAGMHPRRALIESYMREWLSDPATASARLARWEGTTTGDAIEEGRQMAEAALSANEREILELRDERETLRAERDELADALRWIANNCKPYGPAQAHAHNSLRRCGLPDGFPRADRFDGALSDETHPDTEGR